jgi:hypothetical protein
MIKKKNKNKVDSSAELKTRQLSQPFFGNTLDAYSIK